MSNHINDFFRFLTEMTEKYADNLKGYMSRDKGKSLNERCIDSEAGGSSDLWDTDLGLTRFRDNRAWAR